MKEEDKNKDSHRYVYGGISIGKSSGISITRGYSESVTEPKSKSCSCTDPDCPICSGKPDVASGDILKPEPPGKVFGLQVFMPVDGVLVPFEYWEVMMRYFLKDRRPDRRRSEHALAKDGKTCRLCMPTHPMRRGIDHTDRRKRKRPR